MYSFGPGGDQLLFSIILHFPHYPSFLRRFEEKKVQKIILLPVASKTLNYTDTLCRMSNGFFPFLDASIAQNKV